MKTCLSKWQLVCVDVLSNATWQLPEVRTPQAQKRKRKTAWAEETLPTSIKEKEKQASCSDFLQWFFCRSIHRLYSSVKRCWFQIMSGTQSYNGLGFCGGIKPEQTLTT
eukprot:1146047-Pelagomonas_calceolata.AAC.3